MRIQKLTAALTALLLVFGLFSMQLRAEDENHEGEKSRGHLVGSLDLLGYKNNSDYNKFSFGISGGVLISFMDVKEQPFFPDLEEITYGGRLMLNYHMSPVLTMQTNFLYGELKGMDTENNLTFETDLMEATLNARISLNALLHPASRLNQSVNLYGFIGAGALAYRSRLFENDGPDPTSFFGFEDDGVTKDDLKFELAVPFGLGINFKVAERLDIGIETGFRYTSSDRLDAMEVPGSRKDMYNFTSVGLTFRFGRNTNSKDWASPQQAMFPGDLARVEQLAARAEQLEDDIQAVKEAHEADMDILRKELEGLVEKQTDLGTRTAHLFGAIDDLTEHVFKLETQMQEVEPEVFYSVQVMALREDLSVAEAQSYLRINKNLERFHINGWYKFISGRYHNLEDAILQMQRIWGQGVKDAFVVKYEDGILRPR